MTFLVPIRTVSELNRREHWAARAKRTAANRDAVACALKVRAPPPLPVSVRLTRIAPRALDSDNLAGALKATRDQVAVWLGLPIAKRRGRPVADDRDPRVAWAVDQRRAGPHSYGVEIEILQREVAA